MPTTLRHWLNDLQKAGLPIREIDIEAAESEERLEELEKKLKMIGERNRRIDLGTRGRFKEWWSKNMRLGK